METNFPPIRGLSIASLENYDQKLKEKMQAAQQAGNLLKARFDNDVIEENEDLIAEREGKETWSHFAEQQKAFYKDETQLLLENPNNGSDC